MRNAFVWHAGNSRLIKITERCLTLPSVIGDVQVPLSRMQGAKAAGVVLWRNDGFLVGLQKGKFSEPGGKMQGETAIACAKRELNEETGLDPDKLNIRWGQPSYIPDCKYVFFQGEIGSEQPSKFSTFSEYKFVRADAVPASSSYRLQRVSHMLRREAEERRRAGHMDAVEQMLRRGGL